MPGSLPPTSNGHLAEAQRTCLADFLNVECVEEGRCQRNQFLPWEHDEYHADYAGSMDYRDYGKLLIQRFLEREEKSNS